MVTLGPHEDSKVVHCPFSCSFMAFFCSFLPHDNPTKPQELCAHGVFSVDIVSTAELYGLPEASVRHCGGFHNGSRLFSKKFVFQSTQIPSRQSSIMSSGHKYELLCLENPLLDIQGQGCVATGPTDSLYCR